jgi:hypothetical protein
LQEGPRKESLPCNLVLWAGRRRSVRNPARAGSGTGRGRRGGGLGVARGRIAGLVGARRGRWAGTPAARGGGRHGCLSGLVGARLDSRTGQRAMARARGGEGRVNMTCGRLELGAHRDFPSWRRRWLGWQLGWGVCTSRPG